MNDNSPPADHPAVQSAIYHLTLALIRSGSLKPAELTAAARRVADEGKLNDPESQTWQEYAAVLGLAADNFDPGTRKPVIGVIEGGKGTETPQG
ncbi:hypothetical protein [Sphingopyxis sp.]|uniref:hypothetical protein n=1 Tax=Sphingopyxis sp. TaxID=1908224 RepID=UPI001DD2B4FD|nr:hypothetical protein [Sphingopyxis sp.]MBW8296164.1 hypothetical protein [Sphingopyxis sp.]